jgi:hypothetical protein
MHSRAKGHLYGLQIDAAGALALGKDQAQQIGYFAPDLGLDGFCRFFFSAVAVLSSTGRTWQILALTST